MGIINRRSVFDGDWAFCGLFHIDIHSNLCSIREILSNKLNMPYKDESNEIINRMKEKQNEKVPTILQEIASKGFAFVPRVWMERRWATLSSIADQPSYINTVGAKHEATIRGAEKLINRINSMNESIEFMRFDIEEYFKMVTEIRDYTKKVKSKEVKANYQEYMTVINSILIAYGHKYGLVEASVEEWLAREDDTETDYSGRQKKRSADDPHMVNVVGEGGLFPYIFSDRY